MKIADAPVLERILDPVSRCLTPEVAKAVVNVRVDAETQALLDSLAEKSTAGLLTPAEQEEYSTFVAALDFLAILQSKARRTLKQR